MTEIKCPNCGALNPENAQICLECGTSLIDQIEDCLDVANPDKTCETPDKGSNRVLIYSVLIIIVLVIVVTLILSLAPTPYWG